MRKGKQAQARLQLHVTIGALRWCAESNGNLHMHVHMNTTLEHASKARVDITNTLTLHVQ